MMAFCFKILRKGSILADHGVILLQKLDYYRLKINGSLHQSIKISCPAFAGKAKSISMPRYNRNLYNLHTFKSHLGYFFRQKVIHTWKVVDPQNIFIINHISYLTLTFHLQKIYPKKVSLEL